MALGAGFFAAGAYAVKALVWPYVWEAWEGWRERQGGAEPRPRRQRRALPAGEGGEAPAPLELSEEATRAVAEAIQARHAERLAACACLLPEPSGRAAALCCIGKLQALGLLGAALGSCR